MSAGIKRNAWEPMRAFRNTNQLMGKLQSKTKAPVPGWHRGLCLIRGEGLTYERVNLFRNPAHAANSTDPSSTMPLGSGTPDPALAVSPTVVVVVVVEVAVAPRPAVVNGEANVVSWPLSSTLAPRTATKVPAMIRVLKSSAV
jgi:hypothetical protein